MPPGKPQVRGFLDSADCLATLAALQGMGVQVDRQDATSLTVHGKGIHGLQAPAQVLDMGNAGTAIRLSMGTAGRTEIHFSADRGLLAAEATHERVAAPLRLMGANISTTGGRPPVTISPVSKLSGIDYALPVASAQVKSAILLAGLYAEGVTQVTEPAPTRDHTERMLRSLGVEVTTVAGAGGSGRVRLSGGQSLYGAQIDVPGDFSSAAFFLVAGCLAAAKGLVIENVGINPTRTGLLEILRLMGADIRLHARESKGAEPVADIELRQSALRGIHVPESLVPLAIDEFPVLFIAAAAAQGETIVSGAEELRVKESDRLAVMAAGLTANGVVNELAPDGIRIQGGKRLGGAEVDSHGDHRIAMAFAISSLYADGPMLIRDVENVGTSFPRFVETARGCGLDLTETGN